MKIEFWKKTLKSDRGFGFGIVYSKKLGELIIWALIWKWHFEVAVRW